ncbi:MAG: M20/M25/M40 family metallo-hydrolase [Evtepia sp.]|uniref:peptidase dimerization domain-containing protein n=1 Tax=Evtepia sp. TaxID=2773933 RepID=UPI002A762CE9|nr:peptidase dimerization domain-containing protein [Evtepia sp.]MDY3013877.1 M20/M25/M40 family metallo-hydrolase [Evtepia sp.]
MVCIKNGTQSIDSEAEGVFTVSCAGGNTTTCILPVARVPFAGVGLVLTVGGLTGGHSGAEIHKGRANANMLLGRVLQQVAQKTALRIGKVEGGLKDNAIPVESRAQIAVADGAAAQEAIQAMDAILKNEYRVTDPGLFVKAEPLPQGEAPMDQAGTDKVICMLTCLPNGIYAMSAEIPGLVQTSLNLGILVTEGDAVRASFSVHSSVDSQKQMLKDRIACLMTQLGGRTEFAGEYTGWQYQEESPLRDLMVEVFREQYGKDPKIEAIHAGLECGLFAGEMPGLDCVSIGPDLLEIHTPRERLSISSVERLYTFLVEVLKRSK